jgi:uncharacterized membrane protein YhaH (DUF805 family)
MRWAALSGVAFVGCFAAAAASYGSGAGRSSDAILAYYASHGDRSRQLVGFALFVGAAATAIPVVAATALAASHDDRMPNWFVWLSVVAVVGLATTYWYASMALFLIWILAASTLLFSAEGRAEALRVSPPGL